MCVRGVVLSLFVPRLSLSRYVGPVSSLYKSTAGRFRPVWVADGPITARCRFIKNASWEENIVLRDCGISWVPTLIIVTTSLIFYTEKESFILYYLTYDIAI